MLAPHGEWCLDHICQRFSTYQHILSSVIVDEKLMTSIPSNSPDHCVAAPPTACGTDVTTGNQLAQTLGWLCMPNEVLHSHAP